jgi:hypothetical protein
MPLDPKRTVTELKELRSLTGDENGAQRVAWTDTWLRAREWFAKKLAELSVEHHYDAAGNNWATLTGESKKSLILGGHLDSVPNGGWLDGALNVLAALEVLRRFASGGRRSPYAWWTGPTKKARVSGAACWDRQRSRARIPFRRTAFAPTATELEWKMRCGVAA